MHRRLSIFPTWDTRFRIAVALVPVVLVLLPGTSHAATFAVTTTSDANGACDSTCSLREAILAANASSGADRITVRAGVHTLTLSGAGEDAGATGDLDVTEGVTIVGAGARATALQDEVGDRVLDTRVAAGQTVAISGLTIRRGGGGSPPSGVAQGGGIRTSGGLTTLTDVAVTNNQADSQGGAVGGQGGGIFAGGPVVLNRVTLSENRALGGTGSSGQGGGIFDTATGGSTLTNVTLSTNSTAAGTGSPGQGGGLFANQGTSLTNVTVTGNQADQSGSGQGGGVFVTGSVTVTNTIVAGNRLGSGASECFNEGTVNSGGGNLERGTDCGFTAGSDRRNVDPLLGPLQNNGGQTNTHALRPGSPAIDAGVSTGCPAIDQRGVRRPFGRACDSGAVETSRRRLPRPVLGKTVTVVPLDGEVFVSVASGSARASQIKGRRFVPLREPRRIPVGSFLDTRRGTIRLVSARGRGGRTQSGDFAAGVLQVLQSRRARARGLTELRLKGSSFRGCRARHSRALVARHRLSRRIVRRLRSRARGRFRTGGRYAAATIRGTTWDTIDRCDGTLTRVRRGRVVVRDLRRKRNVLVRAGKSYLARAPR